MCLVWESHATSVLTIKYFVSRWIIWLRILATDIFYFQLSIPSFATKMDIQWVDGSILACVFLTSSFCVVPESSYSSNAAISTLSVVWSLNCSIAASSTVSVLASFKNFRRRLQKLAVVQLLLTYCGLLYLCSPKTFCRLCAHRAHLHVVLSRKTPLSNSFTVSTYQFDTTALGSMGF